MRITHAIIREMICTRKGIWFGETIGILMKKYMILILFVFLIALQGCTIKDMDIKYDDEDFITSNHHQSVYIGKVETFSKVSFKSFSGSELIATIFDGDTVAITIDREITEGRFKVVMVKDNDEIIELKDGSVTYHATDGTVRIKIIGDQAKGWYKVNVE